MKTVILDTFKAAKVHRLTTLAQACAFSIILSLIPLIVIGIAVLGFIMGNQQHAVISVVRSIQTFVPIKTPFLVSMLQNVLKNKKALGLFGLGGLFISVQSAFMAMEQAIDRIWEVKNDRKWYVRRGVAFIATLVTLILLAADLGLSALASKHFLPSNLRDILAPIFLFLIPLFVTTLLFTWLYTYLPACDIDKKSALTAGFVAALAWEILKVVFGLFLTRFHPYNQLYGSLSSLIAMVLWCYYSTLIVLFGADLSGILQKRVHLSKHIEERVEPASMKTAAEQPGAIILAGGKSMRMGQDKALLMLDGEELLERTARIANTVAKDVFIVTNDKEKYQVENVKIIEDLYPGEGPVGGILTGLTYPGRDWRFVLACDMPMLKVDLLKLFHSFTADEIDAVIPRRDNRLEGLCGLYHITALPKLEKYFIDGGRSVQGALKTLMLRIVEEDEWKLTDPDADIMESINTPDDYERMNQVLTQKV